MRFRGDAIFFLDKKSNDILFFSLLLAVNDPIKGDAKFDACAQVGGQFSPI